VGAAALFSPLIISEIDLRTLDWLQFGKAAFILTGTGGLFELFLYYGFIHLRLKKAFGPIPAIVGTSALYMLWHIGTQLPYEPDPVAALGKLFLVGIMYQSLFSITYNLLTIWPFFLCVGVMIDVAVNIGALEPISQQLPYTVATMMLMIVTGVVLAWIVKRRHLVNSIEIKKQEGY
jgi:membrane protease YdiL (CAAX protease family)